MVTHVHLAKGKGYLNGHPIVPTRRTILYFFMVKHLINVRSGSVLNYAILRDEILT